MLFSKKFQNFFVGVFFNFVGKWYFFWFVLSFGLINLANELFDNVILSFDRWSALLFFEFFQIHENHVLEVLLVEKILGSRFLVYAAQSIEIVWYLL